MTRIDFRMPSLGADMESATLTQWLKQPGAAVKRGEALAVVETSKGLIDIESFDDGMVAELVIEPGTEVPVGTVLARLDVAAAQSAASTALAAAAPPAQTPPRAEPPVVDHAEGTVPPARKPGAEHVRISPAARRRAQELGIAPEQLEQLPGGVLHVEDVEKLAQQKPAVPADAHRAMRITIGNAMARSKREIPHYYLGQSVDFGAGRSGCSASTRSCPSPRGCSRGCC